MDLEEEERMRGKDIVGASDCRGSNCFRNANLWPLCNGGLHLL